MIGIFKLLFIIHYITSSDGQPEVDTENVKFIGTYISTRKNRTISAFLGIPYAEPPVGNLRFRNPVAKKQSKGIFMSDKETADCIQPTYDNFDLVIGEEDCLTLNVFSPQNLTIYQKELLPVMVFLHPGYYSTGGVKINTAGPQHLLDKNIILVTLRYRLGILGFLSTGDLEATGNFGLKDQVLALKWVKKNIKFFGGNSEKVTLFGASVGANSIQLHTFSNAAEGLFHQCILEAGSAFYPRSFMNNEKYSEYAKKAGAIFNCSSENSQKLVQCLRTIDAVNITKTFSIFNPIQKFTKTFWQPTNEPDVMGAYLTDNPFNLVKKKKTRDYPMIVGLNADEGLFWTSVLYNNSKLYNKILGNLDSFLNDFFKTFINSEKNITILIEDVKQFYFENKKSNEKQVVLEQLTYFLADFLRNYPHISSVNFHSKASEEMLYFYLFNYQGTLSHTFRNTLTPLGVSHSDELFYLFPKSIGVNVQSNSTVLENDSKIIDIIVDLWTSFAINGIPNTNYTKDSYIWKPYTPGKKILQIGNRHEPSLSIIDSFLKDRMNFWMEKYPKHFY